MDLVEATSQPSVSALGSRRPALAALAVLVVLMVAAGVPALRLAYVEVLPVAALVEGIRMPAWLPRVGVPFGDAPVWSYWAAETAGAFVTLVVFWLRCSAASRAGRSRLRVAGQVWLDTVLAVLAGALTYAVASSFLTGDRPLPYLLLVGGVALFAIVWGAITGVLTGLVAALVPSR